MDSILVNTRQLFIINLCLITAVAYKFYSSSKANNYISVFVGLPPTQCSSVTNLHCQLRFSCHVPNKQTMCRDIQTSWQSIVCLLRGKNLFVLAFVQTDLHLPASLSKRSGSFGKAQEITIAGEESFLCSTLD